MVQEAPRRNLSSQKLHGTVSLPWRERKVGSHALVVGLLELDRTEGCHSLVPQVSSLLDKQGLQCLVDQVSYCDRSLVGCSIGQPVKLALVATVRKHKGINPWYSDPRTLADQDLAAW